MHNSTSTDLSKEEINTLINSLLDNDDMLIYDQLTFNSIGSTINISDKIIGIDVLQRIISKFGK